MFIKNTKKNLKQLVTLASGVALLWTLAPHSAEAQTIAEIIDATGDGAGNTLSRPYGIAVDGSGNIYVPGSVSNNAFKITPGGVITEIIDATGDGAGHALTSPSDAAIDVAGNVYVAGVSSDNAFKITPGGVITEIIDATGDGGGNALSSPFEIAVDGSGNVYVSGRSSDNAFKITPGGAITEIIDATGDGAGNTLFSARGIAIDGSGNVYVTGGTSNNAFKITPGGVITEIIDATGDGAGNTLSSPFGIAVDGSGNVYVTGSGSNNAFKITPGGAITEIIDATGDGAGNTLLAPLKIAVDGSGNVYVSGQDSNNAFRITPGGAITQIIDATGDGAGNTLSSARGIAVDGTGNVYLAGWLSHNVFKISFPEPEVAATKTDALLVDVNNDGIPSPGETLRYTVTITNNGTADATGVTFSDTPDANSALVVGSVTATQGFVTTGNTGGDFSVAVDVGTINSGGGSATITFDLLIHSPFPSSATEICNQGTVSGSNFTDVSTDDPDDATGSSDATCTPVQDPGTIQIIKDTVPDAAQDFAFTTTGALVPPTFSLDDDADGTLSNIQTFDNLTPGSYTVTETAVSGYNTTISCVDPDNGTTTSGSTATIDLDAGETITCTFTNTAAPVPELPHDYLFLADERIEMKKHALISGNLYSNNDIKVKKGSYGSIVGDLVAVDDIGVAKKNTVDGNVIAGDDADIDGIVTGSVSEDAGLGKKSLPDVPYFATGSTDIDVNKKDTESHGPGAYDEVEIGKEGTLNFEHDGGSGEYFVRTLILGKNAKLSIDVTDGPVIINISDGLSFGKGSEVIIQPGGESNSDQVTFNYRDNDRIKLNKNATVLGTINAPEAPVVLESGVRFRGAICAERINVKSKVVALHHDVSGSLPKAAVSETAEADELRDQSRLPDVYVLEQNYPNPFNPSTTINFSLPVSGEATLSIYNLRGQLVKTLVSGTVAAGQHIITWNGTDAQGIQVPSGIYLYHLKAGSFIATKKLILAK